MVINPVSSYQETYNNGNTETDEETKPLTAGGRLQQVREEKAISIEEVAEATNISLANVQAMESEDFDRLPVAPFLKGQVIIYCRFLKIEEETIVDEFLATHAENRKKQVHASRIDNKLAEARRMSSITIALLILTAIIISLTAFSLYTSWNPFSAGSDKQESRFQAQEN